MIHAPAHTFHAKETRPVAAGEYSVGEAIVAAKCGHRLP
jgi:hypothetical protein